MSIVCAVPGLIWPAADMRPALSQTALPGLAGLLAGAHLVHESPRPFERWLATQFGIAGEPPLAALRLSASQDIDPDAIYVCADPASLRFTREHLLLDGPATLDLQAGELEALFADLNTGFGDIGRFELMAGQGYLRLLPQHTDKLPVQLSPLSEVTGRPVALFQPQGAQATWWARLSNELQVSCHNHTVNTAREARGAAPLNAIWLWGAGTRPERIATPATRLAGSHKLLKGLARCAGTPLDSVNMRSPADWTLIDALLSPAIDRDANAWLAALLELDGSVFLPLLQAVRSGKTGTVRLIAPSDSTLATFETRPAPRWKFWRSKFLGNDTLADLLIHTT